MIKVELAQKLGKLIAEGSNFLLIGHENPDGDALGALSAFASYLKALGKSSRIVVATDPSPIFSFIENFSEIRSDYLSGDYDAIILLDNGDLKRTGFYSRILSAKKNNVPLVNIDHHIQNDIWKIAKINIANPDASSTCELLYDLFILWGVDIDRDMATSLLTGIYYDTGGFQHQNTTEKVLLIASELMHKGAKLKEIAKSLTQSRSISTLKLWGIALSRMTTKKNLGIVYSFLTRTDIEEARATDEEVSGIVNLINSTDGNKMAMLIYETSDGRLKGSLRTERNDIDVAQIAGLFGGGGHKRASGFSIEGKIVKKKEGWKVE
ncbi:MAG: bifunctional oligoribonuclease/PAP phosphatase NrnA [Patescibacteria group bacterium]